MKIVFKVIRTGSGNDVYFRRLAGALRSQHIETDIIVYPTVFQYVPWLLPFFNRRTDADIVHANVEYAWALREPGKPLVASLFHNVFDPSYAPYVSPIQRLYHTFIVRPNIRKSLKAATARIAISTHSRQSFAKTYGPVEATVIYPPLDTETFRPVPGKRRDSRFTLLFVGNLTRRKGADILPALMRNLGPGYVLFYTSGLRSTQEAIPNSVPLGKLTEGDLVRAYNACDALLFPSRLEGFGYSVVEAMACGKPVIARNASAVPELITHGVNGFLFRTDSDDRLIQYIRTLRQSAALRKKMGAENRRKSEKRFSFKLSKTYRVLYESL